MATSELAAPPHLNEWWFNQWGVGNCTRVCVLSREVNLAKCHPLPCFCDDGHWQKCLLLCSLWEWKMNMLWSALKHMSLHAPNSFPLLSNAHFCQSPSRACVQGCHNGAHQSSSLHSRFVFTVLDYRCQQEACTAKGTTKLRDIWHALYYASRFSRQHIPLLGRMA